MSRSWLTGVVLVLLLACGAKGNDIWIDVSSDPGLPWGGVQNDVFNIGMNAVHFTTSSSYTGPTYTDVPTLSYFSAQGWTSVYTLLARDSTPILGAYLEIRLGQDGNVTYNYSLDPSATWNAGISNFSVSTPTTWGNVANLLFPPPPPPQPVTPSVTLPPVPVIVTPNIGLPLGGPQFGPADLSNPEPASALLLISGGVAMWFWRRKRSKV